MPEDDAHDYRWSKQCSAPLSSVPIGSAENLQKRLMQDIKTSMTKTKSIAIRNQLNEEKRYLMTLARAKGASTWLNALPLEKYDFRLNKSIF